MLIIEEYSKRIEELKQRVKQAFDEAGKDFVVDVGENEIVNLVFAGQYSAGKSTIIKMLTGRDDIQTGAGITTNEVNKYDWNGIMVVDTPGILTGLRADHDEISKQAIASADMLVFVITGELFDSHIAEHFRKLAIDNEKAHEMVLVINKMSRTAKGNTPEQQEIICEDIKKVIEPYTPEQLYLSFLDAENYLDGLSEMESDTLSIDQVTAVLSGKCVLAPPKDIAEVHNAYEIYDRMEELNPYSVDDLLSAHSVMMKGLRDDAGEFRSRPVGVVDSQGNVLHFGTLPAYVPQLITELLEWTEHDENPLLIKSCVFHYEFELIHPFSDGNGRIGRLWQTLLLSKWNPLFAWVPVESIIHDRQSEYYRAINESNQAADSTRFIEFMLSAIKSALLEVADTSQLPSKPKTEIREQAVLGYLSKHNEISNSDVRKLLSVSAATANRVLNDMANRGLIYRFRKGKSWAYKRLQL